MPLPKSEKFEQLLASLSPEKPVSGEHWQEFIAVPKKEVNEDGRLVELPPISFWYREKSDLGVDKLLNKIADCLKDAGHVSHQELASTVAAIFAHTETSGDTAVDRFNHAFAQIVSCDLTQFVLLREIDLPGYQFNVGPFSVGPFDPQGLAYRCNKSGSDYFGRYEQELRTMPFAIERKFRPTQVVFWHRLVDSPEPTAWKIRSKTSRNVVVQAIDHYFAQASELHFKSFFDELRAVQELPMALGSGWFDLNPIRDLLGCFQISVYLNIGGENIGFVSPSTISSGSCNFGGGHLGIPFTEKYLHEEFLFDGPTDCEAHQGLRTYCHFLALGRAHEAAGRTAEGFLHHVIALDLLLGEASASTTSVSTRCAALTHQALGTSFAAMVKDVQKIYGSRSKYVHEGLDPDPGLVPLVQVIAGEIAFCMLRLQRQEPARHPGCMDRWLKEIDYLVAAIEAQRPLTTDDWKKAGISVPGEVNYLDLQNELKSLGNQHVQSGDARRDQ